MTNDEFIYRATVFIAALDISFARLNGASINGVPIGGAVTVNEIVAAYIKRRFNLNTSHVARCIALIPIARDIGDFDELAPGGAVAP